MESGGALGPNTQTLREFVGGRGRLWCFLPTHDMLAIEMTAADGRVAYLMLTGCRRISLPVAWVLARPDLVVDVADGQALVTYRENEGVYVECEGAAIQCLDPLSEMLSPERD